MTSDLRNLSPRRPASIIVTWTVIVVMGGIHPALFRLIFIPLPLRRPVHELFPTPALVHGPKTRDPTKLFIFDLDCRIGLTHEALP